MTPQTVMDKNNTKQPIDLSRWVGKGSFFNSPDEVD